MFDLSPGPSREGIVVDALFTITNPPFRTKSTTSTIQNSSPYIRFMVHICLFDLGVHYWTSIIEGFSLLVPKLFLPFGNFQGTHTRVQNEKRTDKREGEVRQGELHTYLRVTHGITGGVHDPGRRKQSLLPRICGMRERRVIASSRTQPGASPTNLSLSHRSKAGIPLSCRPPSSLRPSSCLVPLPEPKLVPAVGSPASQRRPTYVLCWSPFLQLQAATIL